MNACPSCGSAHFLRRRVYRRGSLAVFFGHLLLVPAILVGVLGTMGIVAPGKGTAPAPGATRLEAAGVPARIADSVSAGERVLESDLAALAASQRQLVLQAQMAVADSGARASIERFTTGDGFRFLLATALVSAIGGWVLVRKKRVVQCSTCGWA